VQQGYLLAEDVDVVVGQGAEVYDAIVGVREAVAADD
jgi:hypothetical protein